MSYNCDIIRKHIATVSLGGEYGDSGYLSKYSNRNITWAFGVGSQHTDIDIINITNIFNEISEMIYLNFHQQNQVYPNTNIRVFIGNVAEFNTSTNTSIPTNALGYATYYARNNRIYKSDVFISNNTKGVAKNVITREEITQALGNTGDTSYDNTIFYQDKVSFDKYDKFFDIDKQLLKFLYHPDTIMGSDLHDITNLSCDIIRSRCTQSLNIIIQEKTHMNNVSLIIIIIVIIYILKYK